MPSQGHPDRHLYAHQPTQVHRAICMGIAAGHGTGNGHYTTHSHLHQALRLLGPVRYRIMALSGVTMSVPWDEKCRPPDLAIGGKDFCKAPLLMAGNSLPVFSSAPHDNRVWNNLVKPQGGSNPAPQLAPSAQIW